MAARLSGVDPILCAPLLRAVDGHLLALLRSLEPAEWALPTLAPGWQVRDVAGHLLDTALRKLSLVRDGWFSEPVEIRSSADLAALVNRLNREGVAVYRRLSPDILISMMEQATAASADWHESLSPFAPAALPVSWAGEERSLNWFDTARELTERWHHQQQIRIATGRPGLYLPELYHPVLDCFLRGLPFALRDTPAEPGTTLAIEITGNCGGLWVLEHADGKWNFRPEPADADTARATVPQEIAWRIFTRGISRNEARASVRLEGNRALAESVLQLTAIVA